MSTQHTPWPWWTTDYGIRDAGGYIAHTKSVQRYEGQDERYAFEVAQRDADKRLIAAAPDLLEACQTFAEWLRREDSGFDHKTHNRETPEGEAAWREWFYGNIALCGLAQEQVRAAIAKATGEA